MSNTQGEPSVAPVAPPEGLLARARRRGVLRVGASYAVIAWLLLQIADVVLDPLGAPPWVMTALIVALALGFPVALLLAWLYEIGDHGIQRDTAPADSPRPTVHGIRRYADVLVIGVLLVTVAVLLVRQSDFGKPPPPENPAIAVLPFKNLSGDPGQEYFSDGLAVEVLDRLGRVPGLRVIARSSSFALKGQDVDVRTVAERLGVTTVLEGSVRRDGKRLRLSTRLVDGRSGQQIWSGSFDRELNDVFAVQAELAAAVITTVVPAVAGEVAPVLPPTRDLEAHDHYLLGIAAQRSRSRDRLDDSIAHLEQAVALDPSYAQAHAALARSLLLATVYRGTGTRDLMADPRLRRAEQAAYAALSLDPELSAAHGALGNLLRLTGRAGAEDEYRRALALNPNNAVVAHDYSVLLSSLPGREADQDRLRELALRLDPRSAIAWVNQLARVRETRGPEAFREQFERALQVFAGDPDGLSTLLYASAHEGFPLENYRAADQLRRAGADRAMASLALLGPLFEAGDYGECLARIDRMRAAGEAAPLDVAPLEIMAAGLTGDVERLDRALAVPERDTVPPQYRFMMNAYWYAAQGRVGEAAAALARAGDFEDARGGIEGSSLYAGALPAVASIYRATGRAVEASALVARFRERLREDPSSTTESPDHDLLLAELAMAAGDGAQAVRHLADAMGRVPIPGRLHPELPWFRALEAEPDYSALIGEFRRRQAEARAGIAAIDGAAAGTAN
jgi:TolB-like protein/Tfp pilus assembly protein PilF